MASVLAQQSIRLSNDADPHDALAAAYAEIGRFEDAKREELIAIDRIQHEKDQRNLPDFKARLELYTRSMPFHTDVPFPHTSKASN